jgi:hypothetical protein
LNILAVDRGGPHFFNHNQPMPKNHWQSSPKSESETEAAPQHFTLRLFQLLHVLEREQTRNTLHYVWPTGYEISQFLSKRYCTCRLA